MDSKLTLDRHISAICKSCCYHLRSLRHIRRSLTQDMAISVAVAIVQSLLDYCNSLLYDISTFNSNKLQRVQNLAARLALNDWHSPSHVLVSKLHWLPVLSHIKFKMFSLTYKLLNDHQPGYLSSLISPYPADAQGISPTENAQGRGGDATPPWIFAFPSEFFENISHGYVFGVEKSNGDNEKILSSLYDLENQGQTPFCMTFLISGCKHDTKLILVSILTFSRTGISNM